MPRESGTSHIAILSKGFRTEASLGQLLFERLPDGYRPTSAALLVAEQASQMEEVEHNLIRRLQGTETELSGRLTITAPQLLISAFLSPFLDQFDATYPAIDLRILATNELLDLTRLEADLAIRISDEPGDTLKGLRLLRQEQASFANEDVARALLADPSAMIDWVVYDGFPNVPKAVSSDFPNNRVRFRFDDMVAMIGAAQAGLGVVRAPLFLGRATAGLVQVPVLPPQPYADIWVVGHPDVWPSAKLKAFRDMLVAFCKANRERFVA
eukprot:g17601.t1